MKHNSGGAGEGKRETCNDHWIVCPHCEHRHRDSDEFFTYGDSAEVDCENEDCGMTFFAERRMSVSYYATEKR